MEGPDGGKQVKAPVNIHAVGAQSVLDSSFTNTAKDTGSSGMSAAVTGGGHTGARACPLRSLEGTGQIWRLLTLPGSNSGVNINVSRWILDL